jgi:hypothetical protein
MKNEEIYKIWTKFIEEYKKYFISNENEWLDKFELIKEYININKKRPLSSDELGSWINQQQYNYKNNKNIMKNNDFKNIWFKFIEEYKIYFPIVEELRKTEWLNNLELLKKYIDKNNNKPTKSSCLQHQLHNYKNNEQIMKEPEIRTEWEKFITEYKEYFSDNPAIKEQPKIKKEIKIEPPKETKTPSYSIKENRPEQSKLREFLIQNKEHKCVICNKTKILKLLETAHLIPHCEIIDEEKYDSNIVEFMCKDCHALYDLGYIGILNGKLCINNIIEYS